VKQPHADIWATAMRRARSLNPDRITAGITSSADTGLRAARFDKVGSRTTFVPCEDPERCDDGPVEHSHLIASDPTGNAATSDRRTEADSDDIVRLERAVLDFVTAANVVLDWVSDHRANTWAGVVRANAALMPGTVQAGLDVDYEHRLPSAIHRVERAVSTVAAIARDHLPRDPSQDERHWTAGLADEDCCTWHLFIHRRYRRPRVPGKNICQDCVHLVMLGEGAKPATWLLEAEVDRESKPKAWTQALSRWLDELGIARDRAS
jgi:hypothetical protein